jgi:hypothetical protein
MESRYIFSGAMITCVLFLQSATSFALILDQAQNSPVTIGDGINENRWTWQEFRPAMNNLEQIDLLLQNWNVPEGIDVSFELRRDSSILWSTSFLGNSISRSMEWFVLDTPHIALIPEETYRLCLSSPLTREQISSSINVIWWGARGDVYPRGTSSESFLDFGFRTWAVPEPATIMMFSLGGLALLKRNKR